MTKSAQDRRVHTPARRPLRRASPGRPPRLTDAELVCLAVAQLGVEWAPGGACLARVVVGSEREGAMSRSATTVELTLAHISHRIAGSRVTTEPFPHLIVDDILPGHFFEHILGDLPPAETFVEAVHSGSTSDSQYQHRRTISLEDLAGTGRSNVWHELDQVLKHRTIETRLRQAFGAWIGEAIQQRSQAPLRKETWLDCDVEGSYLLPHTDSPATFIKSIIYVSAGAADASAGTRLYVPVDAEARLLRFGNEAQDFTDEAYRHEILEEHREAARVLFRANRMLSFLRTVTSSHGIAPLTAGSAPRYVASLTLKFAGH
jgi:hypothetical protein